MEASTPTTVTVHYIGTLDSGRIFDSTTEEEPLVFTPGAGQLFPKLEEAILAMRVGAVENIVLSSSDAFGPRLQTNIIRIERSRFPAEKPVEVGQKLAINFGNKEERVMMVVAADAQSVTLDGNHPLAGQDLTFALKLVGMS